MGFAGRDPDWYTAAGAGEAAVRAGIRATGVRTAEALLLALDAAAGEAPGAGQRAGNCRDPDADLCAEQMRSWLAAWRRGQHPADRPFTNPRANPKTLKFPGDCKAGGRHDDPPPMPPSNLGRFPAAGGEGMHTREEQPSGRRSGGGDPCGPPPTDRDLALAHLANQQVVACLLDQPPTDAESPEVETRAGGRRKLPMAARAVAAAHLVGTRPRQPPITSLTDVGAEVEEHVAQKMSSGLARGTAYSYQKAWDHWCWWAKQHGWATPYLWGETRAEKVEDEVKMLSFAGFLAWLGHSPGTVRQHVFALQAAHKRGGAGDPLREAPRVLMLLEALRRDNPPRPRKLGVTPEMLSWASSALDYEGGGWEAETNRLVLLSAILFGFFFMTRASEYLAGPDPDKTLRGLDVDLRSEGNHTPQRVDIQFRKTKTDQAAFGCVRTHYRIKAGEGPVALCIVRALARVRARLPRRFGLGSEAALPLFRFVGGRQVRREDVQEVLERAALATGLPPSRFRSHSLRIGGASAMLCSTGQFELVKRFGRWTSNAVHGYLHESAETSLGLASRMAAAKASAHYA